MRIFFLITCIFLSLSSWAQAPYLGTAGGDGVGQYGYLEKDAITFARIFRNTYNNIAYLSARFWVTDNNATNGNGKEYIYHVYDGPDWINGIGWQCGGDNDGSKRTQDYNASNFGAEWSEGSDCYVSVCAKYCDNSYSPSSFDGNSTNGAVGFNERHFRVLDVDSTAHISTAEDITNSSNICQTGIGNNVAGSFSISPGSFNDISLKTLIIKNNGSSLEITDIPDDALKVYYEPATGNEVYGDGNETFAGNLLGSWDGNAADNVFASNALNIPLIGKVRIYITLCRYNNPDAIGKTINLAIVNDGISLSPAMNGFEKMRINSGSISNRNITLPVSRITATGHRINNFIQLSWDANIPEAIDRFHIEHSMNAQQFENLESAQASFLPYHNGRYELSIQSPGEYFRVAAITSSGRKIFSNVISLKKNNAAEITGITMNYLQGFMNIKNEGTAACMAFLKLNDASGRTLFNQSVQLNAGSNQFYLPAHAINQILFATLTMSNGKHLQQKIITR